jgi:cytochrome b involved in lipid metabolism
MDNTSSTTTATTQSSDSSAVPRKITKDEVVAHSVDGDLWVIIEGKVYDVSVYMAKHPGG